jgi:hypothetical protein
VLRVELAIARTALITWKANSWGRCHPATTPALRPIRTRHRFGVEVVPGEFARVLEIDLVASALRVVVVDEDEAGRGCDWYPQVHGHPQARQHLRIPERVFETTVSGKLKVKGYPWARFSWSASLWIL